MAIAVKISEYTPPNSREDLIRRLAAAPEEHAEAILEAFDLLERLHQLGMIDLANGLLSARDTVVEKMADVAVSRQAVTAIRIGLVFGNLLNTIDPDELHAVVTGDTQKKPSWLSIVREMFSTDTKRAITTTVGFMKVFGAALGKQTTK